MKDLVGPVNKPLMARILGSDDPATVLPLVKNEDLRALLTKLASPSLDDAQRVLHQGRLAQLLKKQERQSKKVYVGNIPPGVTKAQLSTLFQKLLVDCRARPADATPSPVCDVHINHEKNFAFLEFTTLTDSDIAMSCDGAELGGAVLTVKRPHDYVCPPAHTPRTYDTGIVHTTVQDDDQKIFLGGLPKTVSTEESRAFVAQFGKLAAFNRPRDPATDQLREFCFFRYADPDITEIAIAGLDGMAYHNRTLKCNKARQSPDARGVT